MSEDENFNKRIEAYWPIVKDIFHEYDIWKRICIDFSKYEDLEKQFIPFNICELIEASKKIGYDDPKLSGIQIILLISIIEALSLRVKYITFSKWYIENYEVQKINKCLTSFQEYNEIYGSGKYFRNFFHKINSEDKLNTITKITKIYDEVTSAPFCYQSKDECFYSSSITKILGNQVVTENLGYSYYCKGINAKSECPAKYDEKIMRDGINKFAVHLSDMRNKFIHESIMPNFLSDLPHYVDKESFTIGGTFLIYTQQKENEKNDEINIFISELTPEYLYKLLTKYLLMLFNDYLEEVN